MIRVGDPERATQVRVLELLHNALGYRFIGNLEKAKNHCLREKDVLAALTERLGYSKKLAAAAYNQLRETSTVFMYDLFKANRETYNLLKYGAKIPEEDGRVTTVHFIDWEHPESNDFAVAEEVTVKYPNQQERRPDVVLYVNGIAIAVLELKKSAISVADGIRQCNSAQKGFFIDKFFATIQFCLAGNDSEGMRYGTTLTPEKYYLEWKADGYEAFQEERDPLDAAIEAQAAPYSSPLDKALVRMATKRRLLDLIENFVIFDHGIKKVCRYNQFYGIKRAQNRLAKRQGGILWHTQGSGKSLTMVWLTKWMLATYPDARVLVVTDREELDDQIEKLYKGVGEVVVRTTSGKDLLDRLNRFEDRIVCSLVHKFGRRSGKDEEEGATAEDIEIYVRKLKEALPADFKPKGAITVFVDECHRTHSGKLHQAMKAILPDAVLVGFTGTPLLKRDKKTSLEVFGSYIHTYKFKEGVRDGVVLDLRYEARDIPQEISAQDKIDAWFEVKTAALTERARARLKERWGTMQKVYSSQGRLAKIVDDIIFDFNIKPRLMDGSGTAILVAESVYTACKFYELFVQKGFVKCAIISSYRPHPGELRTDTSSESEKTEALEKYEIYRKMIGLAPDDAGDALIKKVEAFEAEAKRKFKDEPANMQLLIVVNKLLTGFDAPSCTYLYIDKHMEDHGLFQAICRVNRLDGATKDFGYVVDYKQLFGDLTDAIKTYSGNGAFSGYDPEDIEGFINGVAEDALSEFCCVLENLERLVDGVPAPKDLEAHLVYFCGKQEMRLGPEEKAELHRLRERLYRDTNCLLRAWSELKPRLEEANVLPEEAKRYEQRVTFFAELKCEVGLRSGDAMDLKMYESDMRHLIDSYIDAFDSKKLSDLDNFSLMEFIGQQEYGAEDETAKPDESIAETIENNFNVELIQKQDENPKYFEKMSAILEALIEQRREETISYKELLEKYKDLLKQLHHPESDPHYPEAVRGRAALRSLYDNCGEDETLVLKIDAAVLASKEVGFRDDNVKQNRIKRAINQVLLASVADKNERIGKVEEVYNLIAQQKEY